MNLFTAQAPYAVRQRYTPKWQITYWTRARLKWSRNVLVPTTPMTDSVPTTAQYRPNCCKILFPASNTCSMMGLLLSNSYVVPHWGHLIAFGAREAFTCEVCIHLSRHCSWATSVHVHGCFHFRGGSSGATSQKWVATSNPSQKRELTTVIMFFLSANIANFDLDLTLASERKEETDVRSYT